MINSYMLQMTNLILLLILLIRSADALVGYDCETSYRNETLISLLELGECAVPEEPPASRDVYLELLQKSRSMDISVLSCRIELETTVERDTGNTSGISSANQRAYLPVDLNTCLGLHLHGRLRLRNVSLERLQPDVTNSHALPAPVAAPLGSAHEDVPVNNYIHVLFKSYSIKIDTLVDKIILPSGTRCVYSSLHCLDEDGNYNFWSPLVRDGCRVIPHSILYRGPAKRIQLADEPVAYSLPHNGAKILFFARTRHEVCNTTAYQMEDPRLVAKEYSADLPAKGKYINKLRSFISSVSPRYYTVFNNNPASIYAKIILEKCSKKETELRTMTLLARQDPQMFAYSVMGGPGYAAHIRGEAAHVIRCTPVPVRRRPTDGCYKELPVLVNGAPRYLAPHTRVVTAKGTEVECDPTTTAMYRLRSEWYVLSPDLERSSATPAALQPRLLPWGHDRPNVSSTGESSTMTPAVLPEPAETTRSRKNLWTHEYDVTLFVTALIGIVVATTYAMIRFTGRIANANSPPRPAIPEIYLEDAMTSRDDSLSLCAESDAPLSCTPADDHPQPRIEPLGRGTPSEPPCNQPHPQFTTVSAELTDVSRALKRLEGRLNRCAPVGYSPGSPNSPSHR